MAATKTENKHAVLEYRNAVFLARGVVAGVVLTLCLVFLLLHFLKEERKSVLNTLTFFFAFLVLQFVSGLIYALQFVFAATVFHEAGLIGPASR